MIHKSVFATVAAIMLASPAFSQVSGNVVRIGVLNDQSGPYSDGSGRGGVEAVRMAIADFGGTVLGVPIEMMDADHQNKADLGSSIARQWYASEDVDIILDVGNSAVALAITELTRQEGKIMIATSVGTSELTGKSCSPNTLHWTYNTGSMARTVAAGLKEQGNQDWYFITADYAFGHSLAADAAEIVESFGGRVVGESRHPFNSLDFSSYLLLAQSSGATVIGLANTGSDATNTMRQAHEFGIVGSVSGISLAALLMQITDIHAIGLDLAQGLFLPVVYYWDRDDETRAFAERFYERMDRMPTQVQAALYSATTHYLKAVQAAGTDSTEPVLKRMKETRVSDFFARDAYIREDGMLINDHYLVRVKTPEESERAWDYYSIVSTVSGEEVHVKPSHSACPLLKQ